MGMEIQHGDHCVSQGMPCSSCSSSILLQHGVGRAQGHLPC